MYKLLLATDQPEILAAFAAVTSWAGMGFRAPRIAANAQEAVETLKKHHVDGIAFALSPQEEASFTAYLNTEYPVLPIFEAGKTHPQVMRALTGLRTVLNRLRADYSNDNSDEHDMLQIIRHDFVRKLLSGRIRGRQEVLSNLKLLRSKMDPTRPCVVVDLRQRDGSSYLSEHLQNGIEYLEAAVRKILGAELNGMRMVVSVMPDECIKLLCCPMLGAEVHADSITGLVSDHIQASTDHMKEYLDLDLCITGIQVLPALTSLAVD